MVGHVTVPSAALLPELPPWATLVRAPNPGPMTLDGTNTWVLRAEPSAPALVIDPGPLHEGHLAAVAALAPVAAVVLTHGHIDHVEGVRRLVELLGGPPVVGPGEARGTAVDGLTLEAVPTPGHTRDSVSFVARVGRDGAVLTGDTILGRGTTVVAWPDGVLGQYLESLRTLGGLGPLPVLPGHGPALADCSAAARFYLEHRLARLEQVAQARAAGAGTAAEVVAVVYADVDRVLWPAAELSVRAQLAYLNHRDGESSPPGSELDRP
jgi:glyoxylase-like metal-dependent hydrolase (beta-lactamase superfamily II)